eukprot:CAMPEP_0181193520 /NCGR_PEP_ID=MMETSP1096-20121128/13862_1 /TAXON_ID=156174 ORGANISM="Chrysochromulina ericina, Strain CCMP281" /NCGR_SAMPLE_ID=MMETSP1096 /ASSEMBLY_ACC=CAM_ASM_000453 /LENGTH=146 /DNA_ID=CAMNT_0023282991 /DNA_START=730 /DNA_END=1171 /DNA_ORIENTATION=+
MWRSPRRTGHMGMVGTADTELAASAPGRCRLQDGCGQAAHQLQDVARSLGGRDRPSPPWLELERMPERMDCSETSSAEHKQEATERREARHMQEGPAARMGAMLANAARSAVQQQLTSVLERIRNECETNLQDLPQLADAERLVAA